MGVSTFIHFNRQADSSAIVSYLTYVFCNLGEIANTADSYDLIEKKFKLNA